jgi:hypothetical protein
MQETAPEFPGTTSRHPGSSTSLEVLAFGWLEEASASSSAAIACLAFGGGPLQLLAAASRSRLGLFSLGPLLCARSEAGALPGLHSVGLLQLPLLCSSLLPESKSAAAVVIAPTAVCWTQQADGVLCSHADGTLTMWRVTSSTPTTTPSPGIPSPSVGGGGDGGAIELVVVWRMGVPEPQDLLGAGLRWDSPAATACSKGEMCVNVWWGSHGQPSRAGSGTPGGVEVKREKLRHLCRVAGAPEGAMPSGGPGHGWEGRGGELGAAAALTCQGCCSPQMPGVLQL